MSTKAKKTAGKSKSEEKFEQAQGGVAIKANLPEGYKVKRPVTLSAITLKKEGDSRCLKIMEAMHQSQAAKGVPKEGEKAMDPATVCAVTDVMTGEVGNFVVPAVVRGNLEEKYPDDAYVGLTFQITHKGKRQGKRYADFEVFEIEAE